MRLAYFHDNRLLTGLYKQETEIPRRKDERCIKKQTDIDRHGTVTTSTSSQPLDPPHFSLPTTFKQSKISLHEGVVCRVKFSQSEASIGSSAVSEGRDLTPKSKENLGNSPKFLSLRPENNSSLNVLIRFYLNKGKSLRQSEKIYEIEFWQKIRKREQAHFKSTGPCVFQTLNV